MLAAARRQAAAAAQVGTNNSDVVLDAAQHNGPAAVNGVSSPEAVREDVSRPQKRARTATQAQRGKMPLQHSSGRTVGDGQGPAAEAESNAATTAGHDAGSVSAAANTLPALAAEQLDGDKCFGEDADAEWPPDIHDTVGCVAVDADGALLIRALTRDVLEESPGFSIRRMVCVSC